MSYDTPVTKAFQLLLVRFREWTEFSSKKGILLILLNRYINGSRKEVFQLCYRIILSFISLCWDIKKHYTKNDFFLRICSHLLKKSLTENFFPYSVKYARKLKRKWNLYLLYQDKEEVKRIFIPAPFVYFYGVRPPRKHPPRNKFYLGEEISWVEEIKQKLSQKLQKT